MAVCYGALWFYAASGRRLIADRPTSESSRGSHARFAPERSSICAATLSALISADLAVFLFAAIALFYVLESSLFGRDD